MGRFVRLHPMSQGGAGGWALRAELFCSKDETNVEHCNSMMNIMWKDSDFSDCQITCSGRVFACHRAVLAAASPVLRAALQSGLKESVDAKIEIKDAEPVAVEAFLKYIYNGVLEEDHAAAVLPMAHRYEVKELVGICAHSMLNSINQQKMVDFVSSLNLFIEHQGFFAVWPSFVEKVC